YVTNWQVISVDQFAQNIKGREDFYLNGTDLNHNPIFMFSRTDDYCEGDERTSVAARAAVTLDRPVATPDMHCVQYIQWQATDTTNTNFEFVDLYNPV